MWQIVGYKNSGKTTMICSIIPQLKAKGYTVAVIKHDHHNFDMDHPHTDTWQHKEAGAAAVAITNKSRTARIEEKETSLWQLVKDFAGYDYILVEGFKEELYPKIVLIRHPEDLKLLSLSTISAVSLWQEAADLESLPDSPSIPRFGIDETAAIVEYMCQQRYSFPVFNM
ncbi:molybdopterin-guanine dinucleotide biosynthesis protein B [Paenibacillus sp. sgz500958]|uniref:molybdopterin-guanine dinucleotide biosynthesis protein B n=1 Tax=Paenibacillus sp. sgz500958 TaxID=3242475 RepID=UPI0036D25F74